MIFLNIYYIKTDLYHQRNYKYCYFYPGFVSILQTPVAQFNTRDTVVLVVKCEIPYSIVLLRALCGSAAVFVLSRSEMKESCTVS